MERKNKFLHKLGTVLFASGARWFDIKRVLLSYQKMMPNSWTSCTSQLLFSSSEETRTFCYCSLRESALQNLYIKRTKFLFQWNLKPFTTCSTKACYIGLQCLECDLTLSYSVQIYGKKYSVK